MKPGYQVTEVKAGEFAALDCGAIRKHGERFSSNYGTSKRTAARICRRDVELDGSARLTFEVSDGVRPMQLYCAAMPALLGCAVHVELAPRPAGCMPRDRWL
ncbi:hypothetical protein AM571_CH02894 [Rhizobium etli 8C-3]|uniref:Uncharacterized protein n=1 Tax=Rhizobium etli 8C-3 TaxID=538025 RepID=A0A1L5P6H9_RHIET|nr:hypothetical protein AM571_CH02894 [Rhizobium etli 8C-3]